MVYLQGETIMIQPRRILAVGILSLSFVTVSVGGTITGSKTTQVGTITGSRTGTITGSRTGTITGSRTGTITGSRFGTITGSAVETPKNLQDDFLSRIVPFLVNLAW